MKIYHTKINDIFTNHTNSEFYKMLSEGVFEPFSEDDDVFAEKTAAYEPKERTVSINELAELIHDECIILAVITIKDDFENFIGDDFGFVMNSLRTFGIHYINVVVESTTDISTHGF